MNDFKASNEWLEIFREKDITLVAVKDVNRFISSIEVQNSSIFSSIVTLTNELTREIIQRRHIYKQTKLTDFFPSN